MKDLPCRPNLRHGAVGDQRGARQVAGVFQDPDEQEQQQDLRQEDHDRADAAPDAVDQQRLEQATSGSSAPIHAPDACDGAVCTASISGRAAGEDGLEDGDDHHEEDQRPGDGMQEDRVQAARPDGRRGCVIACLVADIARPTCRHFGMS